MVTLSEEICSDHQIIVSRVRSLCTQSTPNRTKLYELMTITGAHHLAEEEVLYDQFRHAAGQAVGEAKVFHLILDDLSHSIGNDGIHFCETLVSQLSLFDRLLQHHFMIEESELLLPMADAMSLRKQIALGQRYREHFLRNLILLRHSPRPIPFPVEPT